MYKTTSKKSIAQLVNLCADHGLEQVVISPGSRNAALTISFAYDSRFTCYNVADERVAAFFAMGMALLLREPVILCCTSGTASLNYAPAIAEAYHQKIPLLILTADRPIEWQGQRAGQTMLQKNVYENFIKASFELIEEADLSDHLWYNSRMVNEAILTIDRAGVPPSKMITETATEVHLSSTATSEVSDEYTEAESILVVIGQHYPDDDLDQVLTSLARDKRLVILTETTSNIRAEGVISAIDRVIDGIEDIDYPHFTPDLLITFGECQVALAGRFR